MKVIQEGLLKNTMSKVSIIMPVYNGIQFIDKAIQSILNQTERDFEFIIIDDGSTEPVFDKIKKYTDSRIRAYREDKNRGFAINLNRCLDLVKGYFVMRMDDDDISCPERIEKQLKKFESGVGFVGCWAKSIDLQDNSIVSYVETDCRSSDADIKNIYPYKHCMADPTLIYSKEAVDKVGYYDTEVFNAVDYNYVRRIQQFFEGRIVEEILYCRRVGSSTVPRRTDMDVIALANQRALSHTIIKERPI